MFKTLSLRRITPVLMLAAIASGACAASLQAVAPATPPKGGGVDGPFFPRTAIAAPASATTGTALQQQAQSRLAASLGANSTLANGGAISKADAQASGLGFVAQHFEEIDTAHTGKVTLKQVQQFLQQRQ
ncbi:hypothetical protein WS67_21105 [Burkholderia singularis]|uniref:Pyruvate/2-oxoglutarate dehydrogenase complex, dihydrolipoamide dehydrogenase (E3) component, and related enzymes n=1 Tax=Burkholderia singularis TaxID=1503053 RepID=A0A118DMA2_9BURK|nr:hypothetical protein [Burkholderia singularis]KVE24592.1 hypothetical protein WS67_21105 [Burkholderia singularis]SMG00804.1 Pyruvate/2-oxoglutarate dehydrogenase complex, dihydrolipoamide dehydrogenase (E3) component, and related enzymes [Burkholderia singularis]